RSMALAIVWRPTKKAARISVRTEREALEKAITPSRARLISNTTQTKPIKRNRSDIELPHVCFCPRFQDAIPRDCCIPLPVGSFAFCIGKNSQANQEGVKAHSLA